MGKYYSADFVSKHEDMQIHGKYYNITDEYPQEDTFPDDEFPEVPEFPEEDFFIEEPKSPKDLLKNKTRKLFRL